jgi:uncharacterized protein (DUF433 family)
MHWGTMMTDSTIKLTTTEAGFVLEQPPAAVNRAIDRGEIRATVARVRRFLDVRYALKRNPPRSGAAKRARVVGASELRYLMFVALGGGKDLTPGGRKAIYRAIREAGASPRIRWHTAYLQLDPIDAALKDRLKRLEALRSAVEMGPEGEPVFRGTEIPIHPVAALAKGQTVEEILEDYPSLTADQVQDAVDYATAYPKAGRPYPSRSLKRSLGDLADAGVFDVEPETQPGPDAFE